MAAAASIAYDDQVYESPPNVAEAPASEGHTLSTEEFDETPSAPTTHSFMPIKDAIIEASKYRTGDETKKMTARSIFRLVNYACFLVLVTYVALIQSSVQTYYFTNILSNLFVTSKTSPSRKAFVDIGTMDDIWGFLEVEFLTSLYNSDGPFTVGEEAMVYYNNKLLGRPRIRMLKVRNNSCTVISSFSREITECFSNFSPAAEDRQTFGPGNSEAYVWQSASVLMTETISGTITSYTGGGFLLQLPLDDSTKALKLLEGVKSNRWIDRGTRALIIDFSMFNANSNLFSIARLLLELPASGGVLPSYRFNTYNLMRYYGSFGNVLIILEGILVGFIIFYICEKILELLRLRLRYFGKFWDIVDIVLLTLCSCEVYFNYRRLTIAANRINTSLKSGLTVAAFDDVVSTQETFNNIAAVVLFLSWIKVEDAV
ncbi:hypothetical protein V3C99_009870 [Haemonchus contortus]